MSYSSRRNTASNGFASRRDRTWQRNQNTARFVPRAAMGPITHTVFIALMIAVLGLIYLTQVTKTSFYGYTLNNQTNEMASLKAEKQDLEVENARLQALQRVKDSNVAKAMTAPTSTDYTNTN